MADNVGYTPGSGEKVATREVSYSGETAQAQAVGLVTFTGSDDAKTATDISGSNPLPVTGPLTSAQLTSAALATDAVAQAIRDRLPSAFVTPDRLTTDTLGAAGVARQLSAGAASANTALTTTCRRVSIHARGADIRYVIGTGAQTASGTSHYIASGERLDLNVPASAQIAVIRAGTVDGTLELTELT
jgi:hypothetical protein